jgi:Domain of unknown function (DUF3883)
MPEVEEGYFSQGVDYLGFLNGELRGLQGIATLANELIQNADDAKAGWISFDVRDDALVVENGALFSDCAKVGERECPWVSEPARRHRCDWHRFRLIASGDKRRQGGTIGAFGIGFISVYQITDSPELFSGRWHWTVNPAEQEGKRIHYERGVDNLPHTRFRLTWAGDPDSPVRKALEVQPISDSITADTFTELMRVLPRAITFLRHVREIRLKRDGALTRSIRLTSTPDGLRISDGGTSSFWRVIRGSFENEARRLKTEPGVSHDRSSEVTIALPKGEEELNGVLFAFLPTQQHTGLPFHFNADFFTSPDRKRIPFENTHEGRWNAAAVRGGAAALAKAIPALPAAMGHKPFWRMLEQIEQGNAAAGNPGNIFKVFWEGVKNEIKKSRTVFTSQEDWAYPHEVLILGNQEDEKETLPVLTKLGLRFVHEDLRKQHNLLIRNEVGVRVLTGSHLAAALKAAGFDRTVPRNTEVEWMFEGENRDALGDEIRTLLSRQPSEKLRLAQAAELRACAVALSSDGASLVPPESLFNADAATVSVFTRLRLGQYFAQSNDHEAIISLIPTFTPEDGVRMLAGLPQEHFRPLWVEDREIITGLIRWLERQSTPLTDDLKEEIRGLPIWVSGDELYPLDELVVPGNFTDPIGIASIVDIETMGVENRFLIDLGAKELTINTYASEQVRRKFEADSAIKGEDRRRLVLLFAEKFGELGDDVKAQRALAACPIVECVDKKFRRAGEAYFSSEGLRSLLGEEVAVAADWAHRQQSVRNLLGWLGVAQKPRIGDLIQRVRELSLQPPRGRARDSIQQIVAHLARRWADDLNADPSLSQLRGIAWLPSTGDTSAWHKPDALYTRFREYLFSSQADFVDLAEQTKLSEFLDYLGVKSEPAPELVVNHLLQMASANNPVNEAVYIFLNQNAERPAVGRLKGRACLYLENQSRYVKPEEVFWGEHHLSPYRFRLSEKMRGYGALFRRLDVRETPNKNDAIGLLKEIGEKFGATNSRLDSETKGVLLQCWKLLNESPDQSLGELQNYKVIPNGQDVLERPGAVYFDDRPGYAEKLGLLNSVIPRLQDVWRAMQGAGVRPLSEAVQTTLVERDDPTPEEKLRELIFSRKGVIARVVEAHRSEDGDDDWDLDLLDSIRVESVRSLSVEYKVGYRRSPQVSVSAYYDAVDRILYLQRQDAPPWAALARELAYALNPRAEAGKVAPGIKEAITARSKEDASRSLDELGYATLNITDESPTVAEPVSIGGISAPAADGEERTITTHAIGVTGEEIEDAENLLETINISTRSEEDTKPVTDGAGGGKQRSGSGAGAPPPGGGRTRHAGGGPPERRQQRSRLLSYVMPEDSFNENPPDTDAAERRSKVDEAGVRRVIEFEKGVGRDPHEMDHDNKGFDIKSFDEDGITLLRYIEVKSLSGNWGADGVKLTSSQFESASEHGDRYWLYVVERAEGEDFGIHRIKSPAAQVMYYVFDGGWAGMREPEE